VASHRTGEIQLADRDLHAVTDEDASDFSAVERGFFDAGEAAERGEGEAVPAWTPPERTQRVTVGRRMRGLLAVAAGCALLVGGAVWATSSGAKPLPPMPAMVATAAPTPPAAHRQPSRTAATKVAAVAPHTAAHAHAAPGKHAVHAAAAKRAPRHR